MPIGQKEIPVGVGDGSPYDEFGVTDEGLSTQAISKMFTREAYMRSVEEALVLMRKFGMPSDILADMQKRMYERTGNTSEDLGRQYILTNMLSNLGKDMGPEMRKQYDMLRGLRGLNPTQKKANELADPTKPPPKGLMF